MKVLGTTLSVLNSTIEHLYHFIHLLANLRPPLYACSKLGPRLKIVALIDPATERAKDVLQKKRETFVRSAYEATQVYKSLDDFIKNMTPNQAPRVFVVGSPPMFRGTQQPGRDVETQIVKDFPGVAVFIEKPVATGPSSEIEEVFKVAKFIENSGTICSVG